MIAGTVSATTSQGSTTVSALGALIAGERRDAVRTATHRWIKSLRAVRVEGVTMRERFTYRGDSLWWFTELYLHKTRHLERAIATVLALDAFVEPIGAAPLVVTSVDPIVREAARAYAVARRVRIDCLGETRTAGRGARWRGHLVGWTAALSRLRPAGTPTLPARGGIAAFVHNAFWRESRDSNDIGRENYVGPVLDALAHEIGREHIACVGLGPRRNFRARRWWDPLLAAPASSPQVIPVEQLAPRSALEGSMRLWRGREQLATAVTSGQDIRNAGVFDGCDLWPVLRQELADAARVQWPWSARAMDEAGAALDALAPRVALTYAEAGGWGRALVLETRRRGIPSVGLQHGFIYRHWLNYLHEPDEMVPLGSTPGFPLPDLTLLYDAVAARHLSDDGHFPNGSLVVTGSAKLDRLAADVSRLRHDVTTLRADLGVQPGESLAVLAAKFTEIGGELPALCTAIAARRRVRLIVKPHPAETADVYAPSAAGIPNIRIAPAETDLSRLIAATDLLVTMNSTVAIDGLVLGVPALVIGLPNNLSPFVDAGVMLGANGDAIGPAIDRALGDLAGREDLLERGAAFAAAHEMRADGGAAARAVAAIRGLAAPVHR